MSRRSRTCRWTASGDFDSVEDWWAYLDRFAERLAHPLRVSVER